jgi:hypothetical protein
MQHENSSNSSQEAGAAPGNNVLPPEDQWPAPGEVWLHRKGAEYTVIDVTSKPDPEKAEKFPVTVFYRGPDGRKWPRELTSWMKSFTRLRRSPAEGQVTIRHPIPTAENAGTIMFGLLDSYLALVEQFPKARGDEALLAKVKRL